MPSRRLALGLILLAPLAACQSRGPVGVAQDDAAAWYTGTMPDKPFDVPLVDKTRLDPKYRRQIVRYTGPEKPGTIVVDIDARQLALVQEDGTAVQYGVGADGRAEGFGLCKVQADDDGHDAPFSANRLSAVTPGSGAIWEAPLSRPR